MTPESFQRSKLAFIRHKQVPRSKLVRAPPPVRHTDKAPCMRDTLSAYSAGDTISITRQSKKSLLNAFPSGHIAITNNPPNSTGLSAGLSLSCQSQPSLHSKNAICRTVALLDVHLSENNVKDAKSIFSEHSDLIPAKSAHPEKQSVEVEVTDVEATDIESYYISFQDVVPSLIKIDGYLFYKIYQIGRYYSTGVIVLPPSEIKGYANVDKNILMFYVVQGDICVTVNHYAFIAAKAGHFVVPRGSTYQLANNMDTDAILYFTHIIDSTWFQ